MSNSTNCQNVCMHIWSNATFPQYMHTPYTQKPTNFTKEIPWYLFHFPKSHLLQRLPIYSYMFNL